MIAVRATNNPASGLIATWAGTVRVEASERGVQTIRLPRWTAVTQVYTGSTDPIIEIHGGDEAVNHVRRGLQELAEYFGGTRRVFTVPLDLAGPAFYTRVWEEVRRVPYGETRSYQEIAEALGASAATRAVGAANGANPVAPLVPCHRIVGSTGDLTGYGPGLPLKQRLLAMEEAVPSGLADYGAWVERVSARLGTTEWVLGLRRGRRYCAPLEAPLSQRGLPNRCFASEVEALGAGYRKLPAAGYSR